MSAKMIDYDHRVPPERFSPRLTVGHDCQGDVEVTLEGMYGETDLTWVNADDISRLITFLQRVQDANSQWLK